MNFKSFRKAMAVTAVLVFVSAASICFGIVKISHGTDVVMGIGMIVVGIIVAVLWIAFLMHVAKHPDKNQ